MHTRQDLIVHLVERVSDRIEAIADDPRFRHPESAAREYRAILEDEFGLLYERSFDLDPRALVDILGRPQRVYIFAQLLALRAQCFAASGASDRASMEARRSLELLAEIGLEYGELVVEPDVLDSLFRHLGERTLAPQRAMALSALSRGRDGYRN